MCPRPGSFAGEESKTSSEDVLCDARVVYRKRYAEHGVRTTLDHQLERVRPSGNGLVATFRHELTGATMELPAPQVVIEIGTVPMTETFDALRAGSSNGGVTDIDALLAGERQSMTVPVDGAFELHRIGDAVSSRSVHAAIYDALRLCMAL